MKLILTEAEKKAKKWVDLDDASLGKLVKAYLFKVKNHCDEAEKIFTVASATALCVEAHQTNADKLKIDVDGVTSDGKSIGDWQLVIKRKQVKPEVKNEKN